MSVSSRLGDLRAWEPCELCCSFIVKNTRT